MKGHWLIAPALVVLLAGLIAAGEKLNLNTGSFEDKLKQVTPIPSGGTDLVRISLDKADIGKPFRTAKVELIEVRSASGL
jgi:hypothetical protein